MKIDWALVGIVIAAVLGVVAIGCSLVSIILTVQAGY
jgi:hypothetical protein